MIKVFASLQLIILQLIFSIAPCPYSYCSFLLLKVIAKNKRNLIVFDFKSENEQQYVRERIQEKKQRTNPKIEANKIKSDNFVVSNREKFNLAK